MNDREGGTFFRKQIIELMSEIRESLKYSYHRLKELFTPVQKTSCTKINSLNHGFSDIYLAGKGIVSLGNFEKNWHIVLR